MKNLRKLFLLLVCSAGIARADLNEDLMNAVGNGDLEQVRLLLEKGADINCQDNERCETALISAVRNGDLDEIVQFLLENGASVNNQDDQGSSALIIGAMFGDVKVVELLIEYGADVTTALMDAIGGHAIFGGNGMKIVRLLLDNGANVNNQDEEGNTVLMMTIALGAEFLNYDTMKMVQLLLEKGADINIENEDGDTALMIAIESEQSEVVNLLKAAGATK